MQQPINPAVAGVFPSGRSPHGISPPAAVGDSRETQFQKLYRAAIELAQAEKPEAESAFLKAAQFAPEKWCDIATKLAKEGEEDLALSHFQTALKLTRHAAIRSGIFNNIAIIYAKRGQLSEALDMLDEAIAVDPQCLDAIVNKGQVNKWAGNLDLSDRYCQRALDMLPWHYEGQFLKALNALDRCDYKEGFRLYECRWRSHTNGYRRVECFQPEWTGPAAIDFRTGKPFKRIFIYCEQGAGDVFLMLRYAKLIRECGLWQHWAVKPGMGALVSDLVDAFSEDGQPPKTFDCIAPSASLPFIFGTTADSVPPAPYLTRPPAHDFGKGFHVGIVWRGNKSQYNDAIRSTSLDQWKEVLAVPDVTFHSLQVDGADEALLYPSVNQHPPGKWSETASRLCGLNLLISVDTGIVHLAGALGVPTWVALHCRPYFVYPISRSYSPWYPAIRLFKQNKAFRWQPVFEMIANELRDLCKNTPS